MPAKTVIILAGPTASGKTAAAIRLAKRFATEIISADSRQCYRELKIGVARPSEADLAEVPHHFVASHSIHEKVTAATFEQYALEKVRTLFREHDVVVMTGGTGLYIKAFCEGLDAIPEVPAVVRNEVHSLYQLYGLPWLQQQVTLVDPLFYRHGETRNPHRLMRALEVFKATGKSILTFRSGLKAVRDFRIVKIALSVPRQQLHHQINTRVDMMIEKGLVDEVRSLIPFQHLPSLQTVGYQELFDYFNGQTSLGDAVALIKNNTRKYAKRQLTWFKKDLEYTWLDSGTDIATTELIRDL